MVLGHFLATLVHVPGVVLGRSVPLFRCHTKPSKGFGVNLRYATTSLVHATEVVPGSGMTMFGQWSEFVEDGCIIALIVWCSFCIGIGCDIPANDHYENCCQKGPERHQLSPHLFEIRSMIMSRAS